MKKTFLIFLITFSFLVGFNNVLAYGEEVSPMYTYSSDITILSPWTEEQEQIAMDYVNNNCQSYSNYLLSSVGIGSSYGDIAIYVYCFNGDYSYLATSLRNYNGKSDSNYIYPYPNSGTNLSGIRSMLKTDNTWYRQGETWNTSSRISKNTNEIPMLKSNLDGLYLDNTGGTGTYYKLYNSVKYNDLIYNIGDKFYDLENSSFVSPTKEYNFSSNGERQLFSLDFYFTEEDLNLNRNYEIDITNLDKERYSIFHLDNFLYYGLVNDNGLYHWEEIQPNNKDIDHNNWIEDYEEVYKCTNSHIIDNCGFNLKFKNIGIDFIDGKYEKIRFSVTFANAIKYDLKIKSPYELTKDNFYYNRIGQENFVLKNNTQDFPYLVFSTKKDNLVNSIFAEYDSDNHILYASYFDTENGSSLDSILDFESQHKEFQDNIPFNIGLSNKKGLWISSNHDDFFDYYVYYDGFNLYYSLNSNHDLEDSIYIDNSGNNVILPLIPQEGDKYYDDKFISSFKRVFKKFTKTLNYILDNVSLFFDNLPLNFQEYYIFIFGFIIFLIVIKFIL